MTPTHLKCSGALHRGICTKQSRRIKSMCVVAMHCESDRQSIDGVRAHVDEPTSISSRKNIIQLMLHTQNKKIYKLFDTFE